MNSERCAKCHAEQAEGIIHLAEEANRLRAALRDILARTELEKGRDYKAAVAGGILEIHDIAQTALVEKHGDCIRCSEEGDPSCPYYGEPDGCNARDIRDKAVFDSLREVVAKAKEGGAE